MAIGAAGGGAFYLLGMPAPWISGAMVAVTLAALAGVNVTLDKRPRDVVFVVIGYSMGAGVTPETLEKIALWPLSIVLLLLCVLATTLLLTAIFRRGFGWDGATAAFASIPGAFSYLMAVALQSRADVGRVAVAQVSRLVVLVALLPSLVSFLPETLIPGPAERVGPGETNLLELAWTFALSVLGAFLAVRLKIPAGPLLGSLTMSLALHASGLSTVTMPDAVLTAGFVVTGAFVGSRVEGMTLKQILGDAKAGFLTVTIALGLSMAFALLGSEVLGISVALLWLAYAPGGLEVMVILALALGLDPAFVGAHHVMRYLVLSFAIPLVLRRYLQPPD